MKVKKRKCKREAFYYNPMKATEALKELGEEYDKKKASLYYGAVLFTAIILGLFFELKIVFFISVTAVYLLCVPQLIYNQKKHAYEKNRFHDINAYMSQMAQSFISTRDVVKSLEETAACFSSGRMKETLQEALDIVGKGQTDIRKAERDALDHIEAGYGCEKLRNLHSFFITAEERGGECAMEFVILEKIRQAWKRAVEAAHRKLVWEKTMGILIYAVLLVLCIVILNMLRASELDIVDILLTQIVDVVLLAGFMIYFVFLDRRLNSSLLLDSKMISREKADGYFEYLKNYDSKKERRKYISIGILSLVTAVMLVLCSPSMFMLAAGICIVLAGFNIHKLVHVSMVSTLQKEIGKAFPKWLFDIMLLIQRETVEGAIEKSVQTAPAVLQRELARISKMLFFTPHNPDAYMSFLKDFNNSNIDEAMRKLYSLAAGTEESEKVMGVIIETNMDSLAHAERESIELKSAVSSYSWIPILVAGIGLGLYFASAAVVSIGNIVNLI